MFSSKLAIATSLIWMLFFSLPNVANCQQIGVFTPNTTVSDSFFENFGVNFAFGLRGGTGDGSRVVGLGANGQILPNITFTQGSAGSAVPPFGGFDPNAGLRTGFGVISDNGGFTLGLVMGQGSNRSITNTTPGVTVQNGFGGSISSGSLSPFVTGVIPITGDGMSRVIYPPDNAVTRGLQSGQLDLAPSAPARDTSVSESTSLAPQVSSASSSDISVAEIKAQSLRAKDAKSAEMRRLIAAANEYESRSDLPKAIMSIRNALKLADDASLRLVLKKKLAELRGKR
jgi:hypothetical protein